MADVKGKTQQEWQWTLNGNEKYLLLVSLATDQMMLDLLPPSKADRARDIAMAFRLFLEMYEVMHAVRPFV